MDKFENPVVIFDGVCNFCNASVNFILEKDKSHSIRFTANQDMVGKRILESHHKSVEEVNTVFFLDNGILYDRSAAALKIAKLLKFPWYLFYGFIIVPAFMRDPIYDFIARNRYKWFGKRESCRIPAPEEKPRFL